VRNTKYDNSIRVRFGRGYKVHRNSGSKTISDKSTRTTESAGSAGTSAAFAAISTGSAGISALITSGNALINSGGEIQILSFPIQAPLQVQDDMFVSFHNDSSCLSLSSMNLKLLFASPLLGDVTE